MIPPAICLPFAVLAATVPPAAGSRGSAIDEFLSVTFLIGVAIPLQGRHEVELLAGIGIATGSILGGTTIDGAPFMRTVGITTELSVTYWMPITRAVDLSLGAAGALAALHIENGEDGTSFTSCCRCASVPAGRCSR